MRLVVGPTCAGKSTLLQRWQEVATGEGSELKIHLAYSMRGESALPTGPDDVVHFNLLRGYQRVPARISVRRSGLLVRLIDAADEVTVLTAPVDRLRERAKGRAVEPSDGTDPSLPYPESWFKTLRQPILAQLYEHLALHLEQSGTPHHYLCSNGDDHDAFHPVSRWEFTRLAVPGSEDLCRSGHVDQAPVVRGRSYQADYREGTAGASRSATLALALQMPVGGKRVLDIGCAEGAAALSAYRMGAQVTAIEPRRRRFEKAQFLADTLASPVDFRNISLDELRDPPDSYDVVLALNVIHHLSDPFAFLDRAAGLASSYLVLEYPGLNDRKFSSTLDHADGLDEELPLVGVSTASRDQAFVFTPASLERYFLDTTAVFAKHEVLASPKPNRWVSVFSKKLKQPPAHTTSEELRLREYADEIERLKSVVRDMRRSRSWRVTAPMRKLRARARK